MMCALLFFEFLKIGAFAFGGGYGAIPLIRECVLANGWMSEAEFANAVALSESTPGPILVNTATYVGAGQAGILGAAAATLGTILPSFIVILLISVHLKKWMDHSRVRAVLSGIKPCLMGVILATGVHMALAALLPAAGQGGPDGTAVAILLVLAALCAGVRWVKKTQLSPIVLIVVAAGLGAALF